MENLINVNNFIKYLAHNNFVNLILKFRRLYYELQKNNFISTNNVT